MRKQFLPFVTFIIMVAIGSIQPSMLLVPGCTTSDEALSGTNSYDTLTLDIGSVCYNLKLETPGSVTLMPQSYLQTADGRFLIKNCSASCFCYSAPFVTGRNALSISGILVEINDLTLNGCAERLCLNRGTTQLNANMANVESFAIEYLGRAKNLKLPVISRSCYLPISVEYVRFAESLRMLIIDGDEQNIPPINLCNGYMEAVILIINRGVTNIRFPSYHVYYPTILCSNRKLLPGDFYSEHNTGSSLMDFVVNLIQRQRHFRHVVANQPFDFLHMVEMLAQFCGDLIEYDEHFIWGHMSPDRVMLIRGKVDGEDVVVDKTPSGKMVTEIHDSCLHQQRVRSFTCTERVTRLGAGMCYYSDIQMVLLLNVENIPVDCFYRAILESVTLSDCAKTLGDSAFSASDIKTITIPASILRIDSCCFLGCERLTTIIFEKGSRLSQLGACTFCSCTQLTSICIPKGVSVVSENCFNLCMRLKDVRFELGCILDAIESFAFSGTAIESIVLPPVFKIYSYAFCLHERIYDSALRQVTFCKTIVVEHVGPHAFPLTASFCGHVESVLRANISSWKNEWENKDFESLDGAAEEAT
jgi:hypothetical protein